MVAYKFLRKIVFFLLLSERGMADDTGLNKPYQGVVFYAGKVSSCTELDPLFE